MAASSLILTFSPFFVSSSFSLICLDFTCHFELHVVTALCSWSGFCLSTKAFCYDQEHIMFRLKIPGFVAINTAGNVLMPSTNV